MIKINLLAERKQTKAKSPSSRRMSGEGLGGGQSLLMIGLLLVGVAISGGWWWKLSSQEADWRAKIEQADSELERLKEARKKGEEFEAQKALLARKISLITDLKKQQTVPVYILDQVSRSLPEFLWLDTMSANENAINISGKATTYNAVSNFYSNLAESGYFKEISLGRTFEVAEGVAFSLNCQFAFQGSAEAAPEQG